MRNRRLLCTIALLFTLTIVAAACGGTKTTSTGGGGGEPAANDLLAKIKEDGVLRVSTDPNYAPQSFLNNDGEMAGFDVDVANEIARRLGVEVEWKTPRWGTIISGHWGDRWDVSVGSMTPLPERQEVLFFTPPYRYDPVGVAVHSDNTTVQDIATDLDGATIGTCGGCTYQYYVEKTLSAPGLQVDFLIDDATVKTYETDLNAVSDLSLGDGTRLDAVISTVSVLQGAEKAGKPIKLVGDPIFGEPVSVAVDRSAALDPTSFTEELTKIVNQMAQDGTLTDISMKWYDEDKTKAPA
ncbi:MAG: transporter substrate-binding domain-containing protein [Actinomycetota bacterium]